MCGICGYVSRNPISMDSLKAMCDSMTHRGPDDSGETIFRNEEHWIGMAHRRLAVIDLSENGHQPMQSADGNAVIVFNGEIYNFRELRRQLCQYPYKSNSDTEVLLAAYQEWGINFVTHCNGMFAIALYDKRRETLYLVRDRIGQKPLYYHCSNDTVVWASELKAMMKCSAISLNIDKKVLGRYLVRQYIASPDTIFSGIFKVAPGELIEINHFTVKKHCYWNVNEVYRQKRKSYKGGYSKARHDLLETMEKSVACRMVADVPVGILLSGGYDSSIVTAIAQKDCKDKIKTYSIGIKDSPLDEAIYAKKIADYIGTDHHELYLSEKDMLDMVAQIPLYYDEPFADSSQIATMLVSRLARQDVTVVLTGDGGDELFAGYPIYHEEAIAQKVEPLAKIIYRFKGNRYWNKIYDRLPYPVRMLSENRSERHKTQFNYQKKIEAARRMLTGNWEGNFNESFIPEGNWSIRRMLLDMQTSLPDDMLCKVDRASMMFSLEARSPFLDVNVVELALSMPQKYKLRGKKWKRILKDIAWELFPRELLDRPKAGFEVPIDQWLQGVLRSKLVEYSRRSYLETQGIFSPQETEALIDDYLDNPADSRRGQKINAVVWAFYVFQMWYQKYINASAPETTAEM
ncbi:MAG: asparagine synthase (glutamine-hydrolyzing) [Lachnospiraceae bacterium]|nr:asparagine synthase (glutamine-hydrolyzing) [Lachnospiraceae bacterium]